MDAIWFGSRLYIVYTRAVIVVKIRANSHCQSRMSSESGQRRHNPVTLS